MGILDELVNENGASLVRSLTGAGLSSDEAERMLPEATGRVVDAASSGGLDFGSLLGGGADVGKLLSKIDLSALASATGIEEAKVRRGLEALIPVVISLLHDKAGGADGIGALLGGDSGGLGAVGKLAGKLFG